jgi:hypothetical protein
MFQTILRGQMKIAGLAPSGEKRLGELDVWSDWRVLVSIASGGGSDGVATAAFASAHENDSRSTEAS